jgi:hypothetical protein
MSDSGVESEVIHASVGVELVSISRLVSRGSLRALVSAIVTIGDVEFQINGLQLCLEPQGWIIRSPQYRNANGVWVSAIDMDQSLLNSILELVADEINDNADPRNSRP